MQILKEYPVNVVGTGCQFGTQVGDYLELATMIQAAKDAGFSEYWFLLELFNNPGTHDDWKVTLNDESTYNWICPNKSAVRTAIDDFLTTLINNHDITGVVWDFIRYITDGDLGGKAMCYCDECKEYLENYLEEEIAPEDWPGEFAPGGTRYTEFKTWRHVELTNLVSDMKNTVIGLDSTVTIMAAVYPCPWWREPDFYKLATGVDKKTWVDLDYINYIAPMIYEEKWEDNDGFLNKITVDHNYMDCDSSKYLPCICTGSPETGWVMSEEVFEAEVAKCVELGKGCWIWRYNDEPGWNPPDDGSGENDPPHDIRPYLEKAWGLKTKKPTRADFGSQKFYDGMGKEITSQVIDLYTFEKDDAEFEDFKRYYNGMGRDTSIPIMRQAKKIRDKP